MLHMTPNNSSTARCLLSFCQVVIAGLRFAAGPSRIGVSRAPFALQLFLFDGRLGLPWLPTPPSRCSLSCLMLALGNLGLPCRLCVAVSPVLPPLWVALAYRLAFAMQLLLIDCFFGIPQVSAPPSQCSFSCLMVALGCLDFPRHLRVAAALV